MLNRRCFVGLTASALAAPTLLSSRAALSMASRRATGCIAAQDYRCAYEEATFGLRIDPANETMSHVRDRGKVPELQPFRSDSRVNHFGSGGPMERKTRAVLAPPVANQTSFAPCVTRQLPLAAKAPSFGKAGGRFVAGSRLQFAPPSSVTIN